MRNKVCFNRAKRLRTEVILIKNFQLTYDTYSVNNLIEQSESNNKIVSEKRVE